MYPPTPPVTPPPPREPIHSIHFTSLQLMSLYDQLRAIAPDGVITVQSLITFIHALVNKSVSQYTVVPYNLIVYCCLLIVICNNCYFNISVCGNRFTIENVYRILF